MTIRTCRFVTFAYASCCKKSTNWSFHGHFSTFGCIHFCKHHSSGAFVPITIQMSHQIGFPVKLLVANEAFENMLTSIFIEKSSQSIYRFLFLSYDFFGQQCFYFRIIFLISPSYAWIWSGWNTRRRSKLILRTTLLLLLLLLLLRWWLLFSHFFARFRFLKLWFCFFFKSIFHS